MFYTMRYIKNVETHGQTLLKCVNIYVSLLPTVVLKFNFQKDFNFQFGECAGL